MNTFEYKARNRKGELITETIIAEDCDDLDNDYCDGIVIKNEDHICSAAICVLGQTTVVQDCDDHIYCNGQETCQNAGCIGGIAVDCSANDIPGIASCDNDPDNNPVTRDYFAGFVSECVNDEEGCTALISIPFTHSCDLSCGAQCESDDDCDDSDKYTQDKCESCVCEHSEIRCFKNSDCYDGELFTIDVCVNPGTTESYCESRKPRLDFIPRKKFFINNIRFNDLVYDELRAGDQLFVDLQFENVGRYDTKYATIRVTVEELGISRKIGPFKGPDVDAAMSRGVLLDIPEEAESGVYTVRISLSDLSGIRRTRHRDFRVIE